MASPMSSSNLPCIDGPGHAARAKTPLPLNALASTCGTAARLRRSASPHPSHVSLRPPRARAMGCIFAAAWLAAGCSSGDSDSSSAFPADSPRMTEAFFVDLDGNGPDQDDAVLLRFNRPVVVQGPSTQGLITKDSTESFGDGAVLGQSLPGSDRVEVILGDGPVLAPEGASPEGATELNVAGAGVGRPQVTTATDSAIPASPAEKDLPLRDLTDSAPVLIEARWVDSDGDGLLGAGDRLLAAFNKPVRVPAGATVDENFVLPVAGDSFGAPATLEQGSGLTTNRTVTITLGPGASLTPAGDFVTTAVASGSPSGLKVAPGPTITDTVSSAASVLSPGVEADVGEAAATLYGNGRAADALLGASDASIPRVGAQGVRAPLALDTFAGPLQVGDRTFEVSLLFVADTGNDRVLIFQGFPSGSFPSASWVLGQPDFSGVSVDPAPAPTLSNLRAPGGVAFDGSANRLYVADSEHHRILVWNDLFTADASSGGLSLENGRAADFAWGQPSGTQGSPNQGLASPFASSLSSPAGIDATGGTLRVADRGNHRVLIFSSAPTSSSTLPSSVLGQANFSGGTPNRGGVVGADTLSEPGDVQGAPDFLLNGTAGALFVADTGNHRVLVFATAAPPTGAAASAVLGQVLPTENAPGLGATRLDTPRGVSADAASGLIHVADTGNHRVLAFDGSGAVASGMAGSAIGQASADAGEANRGGVPGPGTLSSPTAVAVAGTSLVVSDSGNQRVLVYEGAALPSTHQDATQVIGQPTFTQSSPNGRRYQEPTDVLVVGGRFIVSDAANHRVLIYSSLPLSGDPDPDVVLGQPDIFSTLRNAGGAASASTLNEPSGLASDGTRLVVGDTGNHRVLIWHAVPTTTGAPADVVIGQPTAATTLPNAGGGPGPQTLQSPQGVDVRSDRLIIADRDNHRVLIFDGFSSLTTFASASTVLGQKKFTENEPNRGEGVRADTLSRPRDVFVGHGNLYVADAGNHRVLVWKGVPRGSGTPASGQFGQVNFESAAISGFTAESIEEPAGLAMDPTGEFLVVSDLAQGRILFFDSVMGDSPQGRSAGGVLGSPNFISQPSGGELGPGSLGEPRGLFSNGYEVFAADAGTGRVAVFR